MPINLHFDAKKAEECLRQLNGDSRFQAWIDMVNASREAAIRDLCNDAVIENPQKVTAGIGEIRAYNAILDAADHRPATE